MYNFLRWIHVRQYIWMQLFWNETTKLSKTKDTHPKDNFIFYSPFDPMKQ